MRKLLIITIFFANSLFSFSQTTFEDGYYITDSKDTTFCQIKNLDWLDNPSEFKYILNGSDVIQTSSDISVKEFGIINKAKFVMASVKIDRSSKSIDKLSQYRNPDFNEESLFLKVLLEGDVSLYSYNEKNLQRFFFKTQDQGIEQLVYKSFITSDGSVRENNSFRQQLLTQMPCPDVKPSSYELINYNEKDLTKYFFKYYECNNLSYERTRKASKTVSHLRIRPGINIQSLNLDLDGISYLSLSVKNAIGYRLGTELEIVLPFNNNKWALIFELAYQYLHSETFHDFDGVSSGSFTLQYQAFSLPLGIRYYIFLSENSKLFLNGVITPEIAFNSYLQYDTGLEADSGTSFSAAAGLGYSYKDWLNIETRYTFPYSITGSYIVWSSELNSISIIIGASLY